MATYISQTGSPAATSVGGAFCCPDRGCDTPPGRGAEGANPPGDAPVKLVTNDAAAQMLGVGRGQVGNMVRAEQPGAVKVHALPGRRGHHVLTLAAVEAELERKRRLTNGGQPGPRGLHDHIAT